MQENKRKNVSANLFPSLTSKLIFI